MEMRGGDSRIVVVQDSQLSRVIAFYKGTESGWREEGGQEAGDDGIERRKTLQQNN